MNTIIFNSTNKDPNSKNRYIYNFPTNVRLTKDDTISMSSVSIFNSFFNIEASRGNNSFSINWLGTVYPFVIPDGFYDIPSINYYIQFIMIQNGLYLVDTISNKNVYYIELSIDSIQYGSRLKFFKIPTGANAATLNLVMPSNATWTFPTIENTPSIIFNDNFGKLIGYNGSTYPSGLSNDISITSNTTPEIEVISSLVLTCNLLNSSFSNPVNTFYSMPLSSQFGSMMTSNVSVKEKLAIFDGSYSSIIIEFLDQHFKPINIRDKDVLIKLVLNIKPK